MPTRSKDLVSVDLNMACFMFMLLLLLLLLGCYPPYIHTARCGASASMWVRSRTDLFLVERQGRYI